MTLEQFIDLARSHGALGIGVAVLVLVIIYTAKYSGLIKNGNVARVVNVVLSVIFGGFQFGDEAGALVTVIASLVSSLLFTLIEWVVNRRRPAKG